MLEVGPDSLIRVVAIDEENVNRVGRSRIQPRVGNLELNVSSEAKPIKRAHKRNICRIHRGVDLD
jgi:hypothetical protein